MPWCLVPNASTKIVPGENSRRSRFRKLFSNGQSPARRGRTRHCYRLYQSWVVPFPRYERQIPHANAAPLPIVQSRSFDGQQHILREHCNDDQTRSGHRYDARVNCKMKTAFLLMAQYNGKAIIPINDVCRDYFPHLTPSKLLQKISAGQIAMPLVRIESSQKSAKGVHLADLAEYLDARAEAARKEMIALTS